MFTIRRTWHHGHDYRVTLHAGPTVLDALMDAAPDMPSTRHRECLLTLCEGDAYAGWSGLGRSPNSTTSRMRLELI